MRMKCLGRGLSRRWVTGGVLLLFTLIVLAAGTATAATACTEETLRGGYAVHLQIIGGAAVGRATFDGDGTGQVVLTFNEEGFVERRTFTGAYTVTGDCRGTLTARDGRTGQVSHYDIVVADRAKLILFIQTDPGAISVGTARRQ